MGSAQSYTAKQNLVRLSEATGESKASPYTNRVNLSRLSGVNADAFVRNATLLGRLGGDAAVESLLRYFYGKALQDPRINRLFDSPDAISMENRIQKQLAYLKVVLGGMDSGVVDVAEVNAYLATMGVSSTQFDAVVEAVAATLRSQNVQPEVMGEVVALSDGMRAKFVR